MKPNGQIIMQDGTVYNINVKEITFDTQPPTNVYAEYQRDLIHAICCSLSIPKSLLEETSDNTSTN